MTVELTERLEVAETQLRTRDTERRQSATADREAAEAAREHDASLSVQLSSALAALERLAEEREEAAEKALQMEACIASLEESLHELRMLLSESRNEALSLREDLDVKGKLLSDALSALDRVGADHANSEIEWGERSERFLRTFEELQSQFAVTKKGFEEQWQRRSEACTAELIAARRSAHRATEARKRAEERAALCMQEWEQMHGELLRLQREYRVVERIVRAHGLYSTPHVDDIDESGETPPGVRPWNSEGVDLAQFLQISSLQADLMLSRKKCRLLESRQEELQAALERSELQLASLPASVEESHIELRRVRDQHETLLHEHQRLEEKYEAVKKQRIEEVEQLRQQSERLMQQLREKRDKLTTLTRHMRESELSAKQQAEELSDAFNVLDGQMRLLRSEVESNSRQSRSSRQHNEKVVADAETKMLQGRIKFLQRTLQQKEEEIRRLQEELERKEELLDSFEDQVTSATHDLENTSRKSAQLEQTVHHLKRNNLELQEEIRILKSRATVHSEQQNTPTSSGLRVAVQRSSYVSRVTSTTTTPVRGTDVVRDLTPSSRGSSIEGQQEHQTESERRGRKRSRSTKRR
ncbi:NUP-1 protein [Trypanosoma theileri]|uniref:NUP-1 protein n=1 Tax=Trypanosoma theileri TaxID=67003 RepID=A0A1X0NRU2_9TRYP|nr:NUP-1 protein [Trypanosoma theileri]ORC87203.1 NUP-1 protein [Trypanosoma theileri]